METKVVAAGIDTLFVGLNLNNWKVEETVFKRLEEAKEAAGDKLFGGKGINVSFGGSEFNLLAKGTKGYEYVMHNGDLRLCLAKKCQGGKVFPEAMAELNSSYLWGKGFNKAHSEFRNWMDNVAEVAGEKMSRMDLCIDITAKLPELNVKKEVITRARRKADFFHGVSYSQGIRDTGYVFGKGEIVGHIYDKGAEIHSSEKLWFPEIWQRGGWDTKSDITRVEGQFRRPFLKSMGVNSFADMTLMMPDIWRIFSKEWLILKEPNVHDANNRRWKTSPFWETIQAAGGQFGESLGIQRWKQKQAKIEPLMAQVKGLLASILAIDSLIRGEYHATDRLKDEISQYLKSEEIRNKALERRGRYSNLIG